MSRLLINLLAFQIGWFACVLGAANGYPWLGPVVVMLVVALHLGRVAQPQPELMLIAIAGLLGVLFDSALARTNWVTYPNGILLAGTAPYWIVTMWLSFATTLNVSLRWLRSRVWAAAAIGAIGGPISYLAGQQFGALEFLFPAGALAFLAIGWALVIPALIWFSERFDGTQKAPVMVPRHA